MIIKHTVKETFKVKESLVIPDVIGIRVSRLLGSGQELKCVFEDLNGIQYELIGKTTDEFIKFYGQPENIDKVGGALYFDKKPNDTIPKGWDLFVYIDEKDKEL